MKVQNKPPLGGADAVEGRPPANGDRRRDSGELPAHVGVAARQPGGDSAGAIDRGGWTTCTT